MGTRESTAPMILRKRPRFGSTDFSYAARDDKSPNSTQLGFIFGSIAHYAAEARCGRRTAVRFVAEIKNSGSQCVIFESGALHHAPSRFWWALNRIPIHANYWREHPDLEPAAVPPAVPVAQIPKPARKPPAKKRERPKRKSREHQESDIAAPEASAPASAPRQKTQAEIAAEAKRRAIFDRLNKKLV